MSKICKEMEIMNQDEVDVDELYLPKEIKLEKDDKSSISSNTITLIPEKKN